MLFTINITVIVILSWIELIVTQMPNGSLPKPKSTPPPRQTFGRLEDLEKLDSLLKTYDRRALPTGHLGIPTNVTCEIFIRSFGSINPNTMDFQVDLYLRQRWMDERLRTPEVSGPMDLNDPGLVKRIWKPEVFFTNAKDAEFQFVTVPNVLIRVNPSGEILYMLRLKLTFACMMDLYRFPMDSQVCDIELASFSKTKEELHLEWSPTQPVKLYENIKMPQFEIHGVNTSTCMEKFHIGEYSCLKAEFYLQRSLGYHLVQSYMPTILIVVISWVSFWLDIEAIPARTTLGITTLLTISSKAFDSGSTEAWPLVLDAGSAGSGIQSNLPPVSYVKAMDVWMGACTTFVFASLLEFTVVNCLWRSQSVPQEVYVKGLNGVTRVMRGGGGDDGVHRIPSSTKKSYCSVPAKRIDEASRIMFPLIFIIFNVVYWPYFMYYVG